MSGALGPLLPVLVAAFSLGNATGAWPLALGLALAVLLLGALGPRLRLDFGRQLLTSTIGAAAGYVAASLSYDSRPGVLSEGWTQVASAMVLCAAARRVIIEPRGGELPALAASFVSLLATGKTSNTSYPAFAIAFLAASLYVISRPEGAAPRRDLARATLGAAILTLAAALCVGVTLGARSLESWIRHKSRHGASQYQPQVGFSDRMDLGALDGLLDSEKRVLRVQGPRVDYLRGVSLDVYSAGRWMRSSPAEREVVETFTSGFAERDRVEITALGAGTKQLFAPLHARHIDSAPAALIVDKLGALKQESRRGAWTLGFSLGERDRARLAPPTRADLLLPQRLAPHLVALAARWTEGLTDPRERLEAIERRLLREYTYSRAFWRPKKADPVLDFLYRDKQGHCEYFASALALLGRTLDIPTRVAIGYRVGERSPYGYYLVREKNAHAWVEAWFPDTGWTTRDATPEVELPQNRDHQAGYVESSVDALALGYDELTDWLGRRSLGQTSLAWILGALVLAVVVARGARGREPRRIPPDEAALPALLPLLRELERTGFARAPEEPLERLAARLPADGAAELLVRYAALRYGDLGDVNELNGQIGAWLDQRRRASAEATSS